MPENMEAFIEKSKEIQTEILEAGKSKNIKVLYLQHKKFDIDGRMLLLINFAEAKAGIVYQTNYNTMEFYDIYLLHRNRLKSVSDILKLENIFDNDLIYGYLDNDNVLHTKDGEKKMEFEESYKKGLHYYYLDTTGAYLVQEKETQIKICSECGKKLFTDMEMVVTDDGQVFCGTCAHEKNVGKCEKCGKVHIRRAIKITPDCLIKGTKVGQTINMCYECVDKHFNFCADCGQPILKTQTRCVKCRSSLILNYSEKPAPIFKSLKNEDTKLYFGWEWEIEAKKNARDISFIANTKGKGLMYCKHDGSIRNGCEVVTHPMTYNFFTKKAKFFKNLFKEIKEAGGHSFDMNNTGCHIHISRAGFKDEDHIINFTRCIYQSKFSEFIALRQGNHYAHYQGFSIPSIRKQLINPGDRYRAVNFCNRNTIEVRIYKGTINYDVLLMYLQHLMCCYKYAETMKVSSRFNLEHFLEFIEKQSPQTHKMLRARTKAYKELYIKYSPEE